MEQKRLREIYLRSLQGPLSTLLDLQHQALTSFYMEQVPIQDAFRFRARHLGLRVAHLLVDEKGELDQQQLHSLTHLFQEPLFILGPGLEGDSVIYAHLRNSLLQLQGNREIWGMIRKFSPPLCHKKAEEIIRNTLWPEAIRKVETVHVRRAVLAAWLTFLRQSTGSCFATAPAILIQQNHPLRFFKDLSDLLSTGQLKRTVEGREYSIPLNVHLGTGDLQRPASYLRYAPGIKTALEFVGVKGDVKDLEGETPEKFLRAALLDSIGLTEEDLRDEEYLSQIQMTSFLAKNSAVYYQKPSERGQKVAEWKKKFAAACSAFQSLTECALLRSWEYTIASFCDVKTEFSRWNLYTGLGIHPNQPGGVGAFLYRQIDGLLQNCQRDIERLSAEYGQTAGAIQAIETMLRGAATESRYHQLKAELTSQSLALNSILERRNQLIQRSESLAALFRSLIEQYDQKLQEHFQELFDPALTSESTDLYDDSPAGFRLVYKHRRTDASQWTSIYTAEQYIDALRDFFSAVENDLITPGEMGRGIVSEITTALIQYIQQPEFLTFALERSKQNGKRSPWDYISGGTLQILLQTYCNRNRAFTEAKVVPRSEIDLLRFFLKEKKEMPLLIHSPTHAFIFYPQLLSAESERQLDEWRQQVVKWKWDERAQEYLIHAVSEKLSAPEQGLFIHLNRQKQTASTSAEFRAQLISLLPPRIKNPAAVVDSILFEQTPLLPIEEAQERVRQLLFSFGIHEREVKLEGDYVGSYGIAAFVKSILLQKKGEALSSIDWELNIAQEMTRLGLKAPLILFADTNWSSWFFGFVVNSATGVLELWRLNRSGTQGFPMVDWKEWLSPGNEAPWVLLSKPEEYVGMFD